MQDTSFMAEALLPLHLHWYLSYALVMAGLLVGGALSLRLFKATPSFLHVLNSSLLLILLITGGSHLTIFFANLFVHQAGTWHINILPSVWNTYLGECYLLLYHNIGTWMGILLFWEYFRKSVFFTLLMAIVINVHALVDALLAVDWWVTDWRVGYELDAYSAIRMEPTILIREWSLLWVLMGVLVQIAILGVLHYYTTNRHAT